MKFSRASGEKKDRKKKGKREGESGKRKATDRVQRKSANMCKVAAETADVVDV